MRNSRGRSGIPRSFLRAVVLLALVGGAFVLSPGAAKPATSVSFNPATSLGGIDDPVCQSVKSLCADVYDNHNGEYVGHDEPSLLFKSGEAGSGNDMTASSTCGDTSGASSLTGVIGSSRCLAARSASESNSYGVRPASSS